MNYKKLSALLIAGVMAVSMVGCSKKSEAAASAVVASPSATASKEDVEKATNLIEKAKVRVGEMSSYSADMKLDFEFVNTSGTESATVTTAIKDFREPLLKNIKITSESAGKTIGASEFYVDEKDGQKNIYLTYEDKWRKSAMDDATLYSILGQYDMKDVLNTLLMASTDAAVMGEEEIGTTKTSKVDAIVAEDVIANTLIYSGVFVAAGMATLTEEYFAGAGAMAISFWIDENGNILKVVFDAGGAYQTIADNLFESVKDTEGYENSQKLVVNSYITSIEIKDIDSDQRFVIPEEVLAAEVIEETPQAAPEAAPAQ